MSRKTEVLALLAQHPRLTGKQIGDLLMAPRRSIYTAIRELEDSKQISRRPCITDTRQSYFSVAR